VNATIVPSSAPRSTRAGGHWLGVCAGAAAVLAVASTAPAGADAPASRRLTVCVASLNEPHELTVFRSHLDPARFEFVDLRAAATARASAGDAPPAESRPWILDACMPGTRCDLVVYSAEFAGRFFGKQGGSLSLQDLEEASCQARCSGLFRDPLEVFLLACNTLATKDEDSRTPDEYLQVLLEHGFDRAAAERVVELRYGPLGPSFREALRRVFAGVPRIYGFSSVAPRAEYTAPMLARYLDTQRDYARALGRMGRTTERNQALFASFKGTALAQTNGLTPAEPAAEDRRQICGLYDETQTVGERLRIAYALLSRPDALRFIPTIQVFLARHPPATLSPLEHSVLGEIQALDGTRDAVLSLVRRLNVSALQLELAHFAVLVDWLHPAELHDLAARGAAQLLHQPLTAEVVDIMCEITKHASLHDEFRADDIPAALYDDAQGLRLLGCLAPSDPRVSPRLLPALQTSDPERRQWAAYVLTQLRPSDERVLQQLVPYLRDPELAPRIRWLLQSQPSLSDDLARSARQIDPTLLRTASAGAGDRAAAHGLAAAGPHRVSSMSGGSRFAW
jgi:hypothetical protein